MYFLSIDINCFDDDNDEDDDEVNQDNDDGECDTCFSTKSQNIFSISALDSYLLEL